MGPSENPSSDDNGVKSPPCKQPLEIRSQDGEWILREYYSSNNRPDDGGVVFDTCDTRLDALRLGQETLESRRHPCLLRWESSNSVGGLYWNSLFECLITEFSELLQAWVVVPEEGNYVFQTAESTETAYRLGNLVLEQYDFKTVRFLSRDGEVETERKHRFLQHNITDPDVKLHGGV